MQLQYACMRVYGSLCVLRRGHTNAVLYVCPAHVTRQRFVFLHACVLVCTRDLRVCMWVYRVCVNACVHKCMCVFMYVRRGERWYSG